MMKHDRPSTTGRSSFVERAGARLDAKAPKKQDASEPTISRARFVEPLTDADGPAEHPSPRPSSRPAQQGGRRGDGSGGSQTVTIDLERLAEERFLTPNNMRSNLAEEIRLLKQNVLMNFQHGTAPNSNLIMLTSANASEGKTFTSINLAMSLACERDLYVLLVDADFMRPQVAKTLGIPPTARGLLDVLADENADLSDIILRTNLDRLSVIPAGRGSDMTVELLNSQRMREFAAQLAERYPDRLIIFDTPPILATVEPTVLAHHVGQILMVIEANKTSRQQLDEALDLLRGDAFVGLVLNKGSGLAASSYNKRKAYYGKTEE